MMMAAVNNPDMPEEERQGLIAQWQRESEGQMPGARGREDFWQADQYGRTVRAPWRGQFDMPGNFERKQNMANSMGQDALLREGLSYQYGHKEGDPIAVDYSQHSIPYLANARSYTTAQDDDTAYLSGPADQDRLLANPSNPERWDPSGKRAFTKKEVKQGMEMMRGPMREMYIRRNKDRPFFAEIFGG